MKKIIVLIGSRRKTGSTSNFVKRLLEDLPKNQFEVEYIFPQDVSIKSCVGCHQCFVKAGCIQKDDLNMLQEKILQSDVFVIASPVYLHYMTADLKKILEKLSWWAHTLRLQGKPVVILSTCGTNGHKTVIEPLSRIMNWMGGNVIATANAALVPDQRRNEKWLREISQEISYRIIKNSGLNPQSNPFLEAAFCAAKQAIEEQRERLVDLDMTLGELDFWIETGMVNFNTFREYLMAKHEAVV